MLRFTVTRIGKPVKIIELRLPEPTGDGDDGTVAAIDVLDDRIFIGLPSFTRGRKA